MCIDNTVGIYFIFVPAMILTGIRALEKRVIVESLMKGLFAKA